ncbi:MAG: GH36 C-terminal domain-containing protein [Breznakibacter sp.]
MTSWNKNASIKFRTDVAFMCKLGFDIGLKELSIDEQTFCRDAVANYNRLKDVILNGNLYRLVSPFDGNHSAAMHLNDAKTKAVVYAYDIHPRYQEKTFHVKLQGLHPSSNYLVTETNLMPNVKSSLKENGLVFSGDFLMKVGLDLFSTDKLTSKVVELTAQ